MIFYYNGKYSYAAKVITKEKSKNLSSKLFKSKSYDKPFLLFFENILEINKGFQKTNSELGLLAAIPEMHKISLAQAKSDSIAKIIKKGMRYGTSVKI